LKCVAQDFWKKKIKNNFSKIAARKRNIFVNKIKKKRNLFAKLFCAAKAILQ